MKLCMDDPELSQQYTVELPEDSTPTDIARAAVALSRTAWTTDPFRDRLLQGTEVSDRLIVECAQMWTTVDTEPLDDEVFKLMGSA